MSQASSVQDLEVRFGSSPEGGLGDVFPIVYHELRALAARHLDQERRGHSLQPTALVHEAYLRLATAGTLDFRGRAEFVGLVASQIRKILVDHARRRGALKRGGGRTGLPLETRDLAVSRDVDLIALDDALTDLAERSLRQARVVELRYFAGMDLESIGRALGVSRTTVKNEWRAARAWLAQHVER